MEIKIGQVWEYKEIGSFGEKYFEVMNVENGCVSGVERNENWEIVKPNCWSLEYFDSNLTLSDHRKVGDILVNKKGEERKILGICGDIYFPSFPNSLDASNGHYTYTRGELLRRGYSLKSSPEERVVTMDEVAKALGVDVKKLKIKK